MIKKLLTSIVPILVLLFITGCNVKDSDGYVKDSDGSEYRTIKFDPNISVLKSEPDMKPYEIEEMIGDSAVIVYGTVIGDIKSYVNENTFIYSTFDFEISSVEKGNLNVNDIVSVNTQGGIVTYAEYLEADRRILEEMHSSEYVNEQIAKYGDQYVESIFADIPNIQTGEKLLLFLSEPAKDVPYDYYVSGNSYYGKFAYDKKSDEYYKEKMENFYDLEKSNSVKVTKEEKIKTKDLKDKIKKTKDNSKKKLEEDKKFFENEERERKK